MKCRFCLNPESILSKETCCTGCDRLQCRECGSKDLKGAEMVCGKVLMFEPICKKCLDEMDKLYVQKTER